MRRHLCFFVALLQHRHEVSTLSPPRDSIPRDEDVPYVDTVFTCAKALTNMRDHNQMRFAVFAVGDSNPTDPEKPMEGVWRIVQGGKTKYMRKLLF